MARKLYGAGTIVKLANGKWKWRGYYCDETTGKPHRPTKTFNTRQEAEAYRVEAFKTDHIKKNLSKLSYLQYRGSRGNITPTLGR